MPIMGGRNSSFGKADAQALPLHANQLAATGNAWYNIEGIL